MGSFAYRLDLLLRHAHSPDRGEWGVEEVATALTQQGYRVGAPYLYALLSRARDNPSEELKAALASFFKVSPVVFAENAGGEELTATIRMAALLHQHGLRPPLARSFARMSPVEREHQILAWDRIARIMLSDDDDADGKDDAPDGPSHTA